MERKAPVWHFHAHIDLETIRTLLNAHDLLHGRHIGLWCVKCKAYVPFDDLDPVTASMVNGSQLAVPQTVHDAPTRQIGKAEEISIAVEAALDEKKDDEC